MLIITAILLWTPAVEAVTATPSATPAGNAKQVEDLKDRLATKVAELRKVQRRALAGKVKSVSVSTITIETKTKDIKIELPDDVVVIQYLKGVRTKLTTAAIDKGDTVVVFGGYDATVDILKAQVIVIQNTSPRRAAGTVTAVDKKEYTLTVLTAGGQAYTIDIETITKIFAWDKGPVKSGFSKVSVGDTVTVLGTDVPIKENRISAIRILDIGNLTNPQPSPQPTPIPAASSSATTKPTATPTPKPTATPTP